MKKFFIYSLLITGVSFANPLIKLVSLDTDPAGYKASEQLPQVMLYTADGKPDLKARFETSWKNDRLTIEDISLSTSTEPTFSKLQGCGLLNVPFASDYTVSCGVGEKHSDLNFIRLSTEVISREVNGKLLKQLILHISASHNGQDATGKLAIDAVE